MDIEIDENGNIFIVEVINEKVRKIDPDGNVSTLAVNVPFKSPQGIAIGIGGDIYVADSGNDYIRKINSDGTSSIFVGSNQGYMDGADGDVQFSSPLDLAIDDLGNLYLSDAGNSIVRKVTPDKVVTTLAGSVRGYSDSEGPNAKFRHLQGIAVDKDGNILVADTGNHKIRKILIN